MNIIGHRNQLAWKHVELIRRRWKGKLVVKRLISPPDARIARECGIDGVIAASANGVTVMLDGAIRRGTDVIRRPRSAHILSLSGVPSSMPRSLGARRRRAAIALLQAEIDRDLALLGIRNLSEITPEFVRKF